MPTKVVYNLRGTRLGLLAKRRKGRSGASRLSKIKMTAWPATIISDRTLDGFWELQPNPKFKMGDEIQVDLDSRRVETRRKVNSKETWKGEIIDIVDAQNKFGPQLMIPTEMLEGV